MTTPPKPDERDAFSRLLASIDRGLARGEAMVLLVSLTIMVVLSTVQLILQKLQNFGINVELAWAEIVVRQMVLWVAFSGGALATHEGRHIAIDIASRLLPPRVGLAIRVVTSIAAVVVSILLVYASWEFLGAEIERDAKAFGEVPGWLFEAIIPVAFVLITFHFFVGAWRDIVSLKRGELPVEPTLDADEARP
jgi:TRAP-type C4-dicarboxylate transport system permease small subunit